MVSFGPFTLVLSERRLTRDGAPVELGARALDVLIALVSRPNEVVGKNELLALVWPDVIVEEASLRFHIASLRKALGDGKDGARYITTLAGRGYCFVAPISRSIDGSNESAAIATRIPFANLPSLSHRMVGRADDVLAAPAVVPRHAVRDATGPVFVQFAETLPTVGCAPLQVCDLALQPDEIVNNVNLGDKVRCHVAPAVSGSPQGQITHLIIKTADAGLVSGRLAPDAESGDAHGAESEAIDLEFTCDFEGSDGTCAGHGQNVST